MQRLTTIEPDDEMLQVAIIALKLSLEISPDAEEGTVIKYELDKDGNPLPEEETESESENEA